MRGFGRASSAAAVVVVLAFGLFPGMLSSPASAGCDSYQIYGPIPVYTEVSSAGRTSWFNGQAETFKVQNVPCTEKHVLHVWGQFKATYLGGQNVFWLIWLPDGMTFGAVYLDSDEWVAQGGVGYSFVYIGQWSGYNFPPWYTLRNPSVQASIPGSFWGQNFYINMRMAYNTWNCDNPWATCSGVSSWLLVG